MRDYFDKAVVSKLSRAMQTPHNVILSGPSGLMLYEEGVEIAKSYLKTSDYLKHPDYMEIRSDGSSIKKDDIDKLLETSCYLPVMAERRVFLIDSAQLLNESAQNALLKVLEDNIERDVFIFITSNELLKTIHSRCETITITGLSKETFPDCDDIAYYASSGIPEAYMNILSDTELYGMLERLPGIIRNRKQLFKAVNAVKEKDNNFFFTAREIWEVCAFFDVILAGLNRAIVCKYSNESLEPAFVPYSKMTMASLRDLRAKVYDFKGRYVSGSLNKNDYFDFLLDLTSIEKE